MALITFMGLTIDGDTGEVVSGGTPSTPKVEEKVVPKDKTEMVVDDKVKKEVEEKEKSVLESSQVDNPPPIPYVSPLTGTPKEKEIPSENELTPYQKKLRKRRAERLKEIQEEKRRADEEQKRKDEEVEQAEPPPTDTPSPAGTPPVAGTHPKAGTPPDPKKVEGVFIPKAGTPPTTSPPTTPVPPPTIGAPSGAGVTPNDDYLFNRVKDLEMGAMPDASNYVELAGEEHGGGGGLDLDSKVCFGYSISGTTVTIYSGEIDRIAVAETNVTSVANDNFIYVRRTIADDTMLVTKGASVPADDATYKYYKLYQFSVASGVATIKRIWRPFAIEGAAAGAAAGVEGTVTVVADMRYDTFTHQLQKKTKILTYSNGILTEIETESWTMIAGGQAEVCP